MPANQRQIHVFEPCERNFKDTCSAVVSSPFKGHQTAQEVYEAMNTPPLLRPAFLLLILIVGHGAAHWLLAIVPDNESIVARSELQGWIATSEVILAATWLTIGTSPIVLRLSGFLLVVFLLVLTLSPYYMALSTPWDVLYWGTYFWASVGGSLSMCAPFESAGVVLALSIARRRGLRAHHPSDRARRTSAASNRTLLQFSLLDVFVGITAFAFLLGSILLMQPYPSWIADLCTHWWWWWWEPAPETSLLLFMHAMDGLWAGVLALLALWAVLSRRTAWLRVLTLLTVSVVFSFVTLYAAYCIDPRIGIPGAYSLIEAVTVPVFLAGSLAIVRCFGYRVVGRFRIPGGFRGHEPI